MDFCKFEYCGVTPQAQGIAVAVWPGGSEIDGGVEYSQSEQLFLVFLHS